MYYAARSGSVETFEWLAGYSCILTKKIFLASLRSNNVTMLKWMIDHKCPSSDNSLAYCAKYNCLETFKYIEATMKDISYIKLTSVIIENDSMDVLKYLLGENKILKTHELPLLAARYGKYNMFLFLQSECPVMRNECIAEIEKSIRLMLVNRYGSSLKDYQLIKNILRK